MNKSDQKSISSSHIEHPKGNSGTNEGEILENFVSKFTTEFLNCDSSIDLSHQKDNFNYKGKGTQQIVNFILRDLGRGFCHSFSSFPAPPPKIHYLTRWRNIYHKLVSVRDM